MVLIYVSRARTNLGTFPELGVNVGCPKLKQEIPKGADSSTPLQRYFDFHGTRHTKIKYHLSRICEPCYSPLSCAVWNLFYVDIASDASVDLLIECCPF